MRSFLPPQVSGQLVTQGSSETLRDALWFSDYLLTLLKSGSRAERAKTEHPAEARICSVVLDCGIMKGGSAGPSAPNKCSKTILAELTTRYDLIKQAVSLGVGHIDELVADLYDKKIGDYSAAKRRLLELEPAIPSNGADHECERILVALGLSPNLETGEGGTWEPTALCQEIRRTALEVSIKLKLRLWFSNREQSVWRTLQGLLKAKDALTILQVLSHTASTSVSLFAPIH